MPLKAKRDHPKSRREIDIEAGDKPAFSKMGVIELKMLKYVDRCLLWVCPDCGELIRFGFTCGRCSGAETNSKRRMNESRER